MRYRLKTWHLEGLLVASALTTSVLLLGRVGDWREWLAALGVQLGFHHASVANRLQEAEDGRQERQESLGDVALPSQHRVECVRWLTRYWVLKEVAWVAYFLATGAVSPLVGCAVFLLHPVWRRWYRSWWPRGRERARLLGEMCSGASGRCDLVTGHPGDCVPQSTRVDSDFNPYTCRLLRRIDGVLYRLHRWNIVWRGGHVCRLHPSGSAVEVPTHFPDWMYVLAARVQNRWLWTRYILSA